MVPPEAFSIDCAHASADGCIGCDGGTQCEKRHSTVLSCASAGAAHSMTVAAISPMRFIPFLPTSFIVFSQSASDAGRVDQRPDIRDRLNMPQLLHQSFCT